MRKRYGKNKKEGFNTSVPDLIEQVNETLDLFRNSPVLPFPWPSYVPSLEHIYGQISHLETSFKVVDGVPKPELPLLAVVMQARRELKTSLSKVLRYVEQAVVEDDHVLQWPDFNQRRVPIEKGSCSRSKRQRRGKV